MTVENDGFVRRIPFVQVFAPIDPDGVGVLAAVDTDVVGEEEPGLDGLS